MFNAKALKQALLERRSQGDDSIDDTDIQQALDVYEDVFNHRAFTGRSGAFFGYEGLGSIYWHMVSKMLLAVMEVHQQARSTGADEQILHQLAECYYDIRSGLGVAKSPEQYGAFPMDAYSHTPGGAGAKQPGMTGQVKEDVLTRFGELGVHVEAGRLVFDDGLLRRSEFLTQPGAFEYFSITGEKRSLPVNPGCIAFTYCQTPIIYHLSERPGIRVTMRDGTKFEEPSLVLDPETSASIFSRDGKVDLVEVWKTATVE